MGNIVEGSYKEIYSDFNSIPNQIDAQFLDETGNYEQEMVSIFDADRIDQPINSNTIQLYGFTDRARVKREIAFSLRKAKSLKKALEFEAGFDAVIAEIGDIILFQHDTPQYGSGGRIKSVSGNQLILDVPATCIKSGTYALKIRRQNGTIYTHTFSASAGASFPSITTNHDGTVSEGDIWICGTSESEAKPYRIVATEKGDDEKIRITAEEYNESIYNDEVTSLVKI
ncbi:MAG: phage tail protein [Geovibrio sp.]|nr:phage tail protein [Geovibrio sp.]